MDSTLIGLIIFISNTVVVKGEMLHEVSVMTHRDVINIRNMSRVSHAF